MAPTQGQLPRLSAALRQFTDVSHRRSVPQPEGAAAAESVLARRLRQRAEQQKRWVRETGRRAEMVSRTGRSKEKAGQVCRQVAETIGQAVTTYGSRTSKLVIPSTTGYPLVDIHPELVVVGHTVS